MSIRLDVPGLREFRTELRRISKDLPREVREANKEAAELLVDPARAVARSRPHPRPGSALTATIRSTATQRSAALNIGNARRPYGHGQEFGSVKYKQFPAPNRRGYILGEAIRENIDDVVEVYGARLDELSRAAFPGR